MVLQFRDFQRLANFHPLIGDHRLHVHVVTSTSEDLPMVTTAVITAMPACKSLFLGHRLMACLALCVLSEEDSHDIVVNLTSVLIFDLVFDE